MTRPLFLTMSVFFFLLSPREGATCPQHLAPCTCEQRPLGPEVSCDHLHPGQLREVLDVLHLSSRRVWFLRIVGTDLSAEKGTAGLLRGLDLANLVLESANITAVDLSDEESSMESLDLSLNRLSRVPRALPPSLAALSLAGNLLESLEAHAFSELQSLLLLSLAGNRIRLVDSRAFLGTHLSLTRLDLGGNGLGQVPRYALQRLQCLQGLRLHDNRISELVTEHLPPSLLDLDLSGNALPGLEADAFRPLSRLSALDLQDNHIEEVHEHAFRGTHDTLEWLKLGGNRLKGVPLAALRPLRRLRQLDLRRNRLSRLRREDFEGYGASIRFLFLQKNSIQSISSGALDSLESAQWLYLHSNALTDLHQDTFAPVLDKLHVLDLHDNPYQCDCHILWFRDWSLAKGRDVVNLPRETRCNATREPLSNLSNNSLACAGRAASANHGDVERMVYVVLAVLLVATCS